MAAFDFGGYRVVSYENGWMVQELRTKKTGTKAGEIYPFTLSYHANVGAALGHLVDLRLRDSNATTLEGLRNAFLEVRRELETLFEVAR